MLKGVSPGLETALLRFMGEDVKLDILKIDGSTTGEQVTLQKDIFEIEPNDHVIWQSVTAELANRRQGTAATKTRTDVRGGGRKPWKQKGRGTARAGTIRSPLWVGGGRVFGPSPRSYRTRLPKKVNRLARRSALTYKAIEEKIRLVEDFSFDAPKTKEMLNILRQLNLSASKVLVLVPETNHHVWLSCRNLSSVTIKEASSFSTYDVMNAEILLIQKSALDIISEVLNS